MGNLAQLSLLGLLVIVFVIGAVVALLGVLAKRRRRKELKLRYERRRARTWERYLQEQERWRQRRLHDIVRLLINRNEAAEGIPLATHAPNEPEVSCRRKQHRPWHSELTRQLHNELWAREDAELPEEIRIVIHTSLEDLIANGRPPEATAGPDILQMLLDGHELREIVSDSDISSYAASSPVSNSHLHVDRSAQNRNHNESNNNNSSSSSSVNVNINSNNNSNVNSDSNNDDLFPSSPSEASNETPRVNDNNTRRSHPVNVIVVSPVNDINTDRSNDNNNNNNNNNNNSINSNGAASDNNSESTSIHSNANDNIFVDNEADTDPLHEYQQRIQREEEERRELLLEELYAECEGETSPRKRRYPPVEEVYGLGYVYLINPNNNDEILYGNSSHHHHYQHSECDRYELRRSKSDMPMTLHDRITSFFGFFTPHTPFFSHHHSSNSNNNNSNNNTNMRHSAFENRSPTLEMSNNSFTCMNEEHYDEGNRSDYSHSAKNNTMNAISCPEQYLRSYSKLSAREKVSPYEI